MAPDRTRTGSLFEKTGARPSDQGRHLRRGAAPALRAEFSARPETRDPPLPAKIFEAL